MRLSKIIILPWKLITKSPIRCTSKIAVELPPDLKQTLENEEVKARHHPGICKISLTEVPANIQKGLLRAMGDFPLKNLIRDGQALSRYLNARHPPPEPNQIKNKIADIESKIELKMPKIPTNSDNLSEEKLFNYQRKRDKKIQKILKERIIAWKPSNYGRYESLAYAFGRSAQEYAILMKIFKEIQNRDPTFKPRSFFDFGSGCGTGMWAASSLWKQTIFEYFNVDSSRDMNDLSDLILRDGYENKQISLKNVFYRQFFPAADTNYDLVISSFSLFELPDSKSRKETLLNLWKRCTGYLVIVEEGSRRGFELVIEARDYLVKENGNVFSPCPHKLVCPRFSNLNDKTPCNFLAHYVPLGKKAVKANHLYSYVVLKKPSSTDDTNWPRIIRPVLVKARHSICRMCTDKGELQEITFTASKHGKFAYRCAKSSNWGDRLPIKIGEKFETNTTTEIIKKKHEDKLDKSHSEKEDT